MNDHDFPVPVDVQIRRSERDRHIEEIDSTLDGWIELDDDARHIMESIRRLNKIERNFV